MGSDARSTITSIDDAAAAAAGDDDDGGDGDDDDDDDESLFFGEFQIERLLEPDQKDP